MISVHCPLPLLKPDTPPVLITRQCTDRGWSEPSVPYYTACYYEGEEEEEDGDMGKEVQWRGLIYSVGYGASLAALFIAVLLYCCFRLLYFHIINNLERLLCKRNYIHLHLFASFMLRSLAVFVKDVVLFADKSTDHCTVSTLWCKAAVTFFHFCVLCNFCWLLVEGLYLQSLLLFTFSHTTKPSGSTPSSAGVCSI
ncbi:hypothetical protein F7725_014654 [Dissostichus mawsoni]|uniref:G-protein coupled receptors family 2 profile 2 domain-containing protein n=1 Tax=Dissostichus mawsoni TaxID=36200 RepID=A0A7J5YX16_DISMA|nr:hypothetical protein F7725_014654 [Dissostichus mawsoni]